jgi:hypothetical protein
MTSLGYPCARTAKPPRNDVLRVEVPTGRSPTTPRSRSIRMKGDAWSAGAGVGSVSVASVGRPRVRESLE